MTIIFLCNLVGAYFGFYNFWWFDTSLHFLGGFFVAMLMSYYLAEHLGKSKLKNVLILAGMTAFIGVVWEFAEYAAAQTLVEPLYNNFGFRAYFIGDLDDTIKDLFMDILGGLTFAIFYVFKKQRNHSE